MKNKKISVLIQARTSSTRLPSKILKKIENKPMIWHVITRVKKIKSVQQIALITTTRKQDDVLLKIAEKNGIIGFAGSSFDVLDRHYQCAHKINADPIIRITGDCPLIDPYLVEKMLKFYLEHNYGYVTNRSPPTYPDGLDTEIFSFAVLKKATLYSQWKSEREHVTPYFINNPKKFKIFNYKHSIDLSYLRWTVDEDSDLRFVRKIYSKMKPRTIFSMNAVLKLLKKEPQLLEINKGIIRNEGYLKSLKHDGIIKSKQTRF